MSKKRKMMDLNLMGWVTQDLEWLRLTLEYGEIPVKGEMRIYEVLKQLKSNYEGSVDNKDIIEEMDYWLGKLRRYKSGKKLTKSDNFELYSDVQDWSAILRDNLNRVKALQLYTKGTLNYDKLIADGAKDFFSKSTYWNKLTKTSKSDLEDAGFCLACQTPTSSAISSLRAAEDIFRSYYKKKTNKSVGSKTWDQCLGILRKEPRIDKELIGHLDYIRKYKRNAAAHPGKIFNQKESEKIFLTVIEAIEMMFKDLG